MCTGKQIENEAGEPIVQGPDQGWEQGVVNVGQIDVAARNKEIYQKHKKGNYRHFLGNMIQILQ